MPVDWIQVYVLGPASGGASRIERTLMPVSSPRHFPHLRVVPIVQGTELANPSKGFGMPRVARPPLGQDRPDGMQFAMLAKQMLAAEQRRIDIPDSHNSLPWLIPG